MQKPLFSPLTIGTRFISATLVSTCLVYGAPKSGDLRAPAASSALQQPAAADRPAAGPSEADWTKLLMGPSSPLSSSGQMIYPAGKSLKLAGRVMSLALAQHGRYLLVKTDSGLSVVDANSLRLMQNYTLPDKDGGSMYGMVVSAEGNTVYLTGKKRHMYTAAVDSHGDLTFGPAIDLAVNKKNCAPLGLALVPNTTLIAVALSVANEVALVNLSSGAVVERIPVGICPYGVVASSDGSTLFVSNFGGRRPDGKDRVENSAGSEVAVAANGVALRGSVSVIQVDRARVIGEVETGIHPEAMTLSPDGKSLYVVDSSGDGISVVDVFTWKRQDAFNTKPSPSLPYGSLTTGVALDASGETLFAVNAGNNAVLLFDAQRPNLPPRGMIAGGGFPGSVAVRGHELFIGNVRSLNGASIQKVDLPENDLALADLTERARKGFHLPEMVRTLARAQSGVPAVPVPANPGEPSTIRNVVYIIKENKKFDQVFGDMGRGNVEPKFCEFPAAITPNAHALADEYVLLDNYYCNGVLSCDGHQWATQGITTPYREKDWSNAHASYDFGRDALAYAGCGFLWDHVLRQGLTFRNFGENGYARPGTKSASWTAYYEAWRDKRTPPPFEFIYQSEVLNTYSDKRYPGWEMNIPDQVRADVFLNALGEFEEARKMPSLTILYLPNDHGQGAKQNCPTPRAYVADNDLALGRVMEGLSKSSFWKNMAVFINEDDPQTGADHVDGHRSICLVAGPHVKRKALVSTFYNQSSVLHTICQILGVPPMNQMVAAAPLMTECFQGQAEPTVFTCLPAGVPLDELNPSPKEAKGRVAAKLGPLTAKMDFSKPDGLNKKDNDLYSRFVWASVRGDEPYPAEYAGAHGRGLKALGLRLDPREDKD